MSFGLECFGKSVTHFNNRIKLTKNLMHQGFFVTLAFLSLTIKLWGTFAILKVTKKTLFHYPVSKQSDRFAKKEKYH